MSWMFLHHQFAEDTEKEGWEALEMLSRFFGIKAPPVLLPSALSSQGHTRLWAPDPEQSSFLRTVPRTLRATLPPTS